MKNKILDGNYLGLDYKYNTETNSLNFTKGQLIWDFKGWGAPFLGKFGNHIDNDVPASKYNTSINVLKIKHINFGKDVDLSKTHDMRHMFNGCKSLQSISGLKNIDTHNVTNMSHMFENNHQLKSIDVSNFDTSNVKDTSSMFKGDNSLKRLDLSQWNTQNLTNSSHMFEDTDSLKKLNLLNWNTKQVKNMSQMFSGDSSLQHLNVNHFNTKNVKDMSGTFAGCSSLKNLNLSHWNTSNVKNMAQMFNCNYNLQHLNISHFDTHNVRYMDNMFYGEHKLHNLDIHNFNTKNVKSMDCMFDVSYGLHHIKGLNNFNTANNSKYGFMFADDSNLNPKDLKQGMKHWDIPKGSDTFGMLQNTKLKYASKPQKELKAIGSNLMNTTEPKHKETRQYKQPKLDKQIKILRQVGVKNPRMISEQKGHTLKHKPSQSKKSMKIERHNKSRTKQYQPQRSYNQGFSMN